MIYLTLLEFAMNTCKSIIIMKYLFFSFIFLIVLDLNAQNCTLSVSDSKGYGPYSSIAHADWGVLYSARSNQDLGCLIMENNGDENIEVEITELADRKLPIKTILPKQTAIICEGTLQSILVRTINGKNTSFCWFIEWSSPESGN